MKYCPICMEDTQHIVVCPRCKQTVCLSCFCKLDRCGFCRYQYGNGLPSRFDSILDQLNLSIKRLYNLGLVR